MARVSEQISQYKANSSAKTDCNLANDSLHLDGIPAEEYSTKSYVQKYHDTKEMKLKQILNEQDSTVLKEAKSYTDEAINNQDFSKFAKVVDVQALDLKLSQKISKQDEKQKQYTDGKIQSLVTDVNSNFDTVSKQIDNLNSTANQLFQSVSNGKSKVAAAITDKGVNTASNASFDEMAYNIKSISNSGYNTPIDSNFVNTSDGTAEASDIKSGKIAYAKGNKIYGTYVEKDSSTGTPTYGTDTNGATATANDIIFGKTAYANGQLLVGNLQNSVQEIYAPANETYVVTPMTSKLTIEPDGTEVSGRTILAYSKNLDYCVSKVKLKNDSATYIESNMIASSGLIIQASTGNDDNIIYKKHRYSYEELGIENTETIRCATLGFPGLNNSETKCLLLIVTTGYDANVRIHFYTYHLTENGVIGKMYESEKNVIFNYIYEIPLTVYESSLTEASHSTRCNFGMVSSNLRYDKFILSCNYKNATNSSSTYTKAIILDFDYNVIIDSSTISCSVSRKVASSTIIYSSQFSSSQLLWIEDDTKFINVGIGQLMEDGVSAYYEINIDNTTYTIISYLQRNYNSSDVARKNIGGSFIYNNRHYLKNAENNALEITKTNNLIVDKSVTLQNSSNSLSIFADYINNKIILITKTKLLTYDITNIEEWNNGDQIEPVQEEILYGNTFTQCIGSPDNSLIFFENATSMGKAETNGTKKLIGITYKGKKYYQEGEA